MRPYLNRVDVLIVDDDRDVADLVAEVLDASGHSARVAYNGEEGLAALHARRPDVVLLDVEMPVLTGPEMAYRMFVENCGKEDIPIVLLSGVLELEAIARRVGTPYFLAKPYSLESLISLLNRAGGEHAAPVPSL